MGVLLAPLDESNLDAMLDLAVSDAHPLEVMPPMPGPPGWTKERLDALRAFYVERVGGIDNDLRTAAYVVVVDGQVAGMIRMSRVEPIGTVETGMWLGKSWRGKGVGAGALRELLAEADRASARKVIADTTPDNAAALGTLRRLGATLTHSSDKVYATFTFGGSA